MASTIINNSITSIIWHITTEQTHQLEYRTLHTNKHQQDSNTTWRLKYSLNSDQLLIFITLTTNITCRRLQQKTSRQHTNPITSHTSKILLIKNRIKSHCQNHRLHSYKSYNTQTKWTTYNNKIHQPYYAGSTAVKFLNRYSSWWTFMFVAMGPSL